MCKTTLEVAQANRAKSSTGIDSTNFGLSDLSNALAYPFRFKPSLVFGGLMFMFFNFGQSASAIGGIVLAAASLICVMLANMLTFGVLANTVDNFSQGKLDADFMPSFDDFSLWGDVVHPFLLSVAVYISSFGPFLAVAIAGVFLVMSAAGEQSKKFNNELTKVPGTEFYAPDRTAEQSREVRELLEMVKRQNDQRLASQKKAVETAETGAVENEPAQQDEAVNVAAMEKEIADRAAQSQQPSTTPAEVRAQYASSYASILRLAAPLVIAGLIALLWGLIYFPAACAVAGYTRSFFATLNPLVGLDTIRRLGVDYLKLLLMGVLILIISGILGMLLQAILSPFNLPSVGNIPARAVSSLFTFYFSVVFSCLLGYALFKAADRLKLAR